MITCGDRSPQVAVNLEVCPLFGHGDRSTLRRQARSNRWLLVRRAVEKPARYSVLLRSPRSRPRNSSNQLWTTWIDNGLYPPGLSRMTNRFPSDETSYCGKTFGPPALTERIYRFSNNRAGARDENPGRVLILSDISFVCSTYRISLPSRLQRGATPPFAEICHLLTPLGKSRT